MSLSIAASLIVVGLVAQSSVGKLETEAPPTLYHTLSSKVPGFNFAQKTAGRNLSLTAPAGTPVYYPAFVNTSAWAFSSADGVPKITQKMACFSLSINYTTHFSVGDTKGVGEFVAFLGETTFNATLAAKANGKNCKLGATISAPKLKVRLFTEDLKASADAFQEPSVSRQLETVVVKSLKGSLPTILQNLMAKSLPSLLDVDNLCKVLRASSADNFPQPVLLDGNSPVISSLSDILKGFLNTKQ